MKTKNILVLTILAVIVLSGVLVYALGQVKSQNELASTLANQSDVINNANNLARTTRADKDNATQNLGVLDQVTLNQSEIVPFIELIETTARQMGLSVKIASVNADPAPKVASTTPTNNYVPPQAVHLSLGTDGSWSSSFGFLHALENLPQKTNLDSVTLDFAPAPVDQGSTTTPSGGNWHGSFTLTTYVFQN